MLMPPSSDRADHYFIQNCFESIPFRWRKYASEKYEQIYQHALLAEDCPVKKPNAARRAANLWLLRQKNRATMFIANETGNSNIL